MKPMARCKQCIQASTQQPVHRRAVISRPLGGPLTDLWVGALDLDGLQVHVETHHEGLASLAGLRPVGGDGQRGGAAHGLQEAEAVLLGQQGVHTKLAQADGPGEGITWLEGRVRAGGRARERERERERARERDVNQKRC